MTLAADTHEFAGELLRRFRDDGVALLGPVVDAGRCAQLLKQILATRPFGADCS